MAPLGVRQVKTWKGRREVVEHLHVFTNGDEAEITGNGDRDRVTIDDFAKPIPERCQARVAGALGCLGRWSRLPRAHYSNNIGYRKAQLQYDQSRSVVIDAPYGPKHIAGDREHKSNPAMIFVS